MSETTYVGYIIADSSEKEFLESLGIKLGPYNDDRKEFNACVVSQKALEQLNSHWGRIFWALMDFTADWGPIEKFFENDAEKISRFMFMGTTSEGIRLYKDKVTRNYLNISKDGKTFKYIQKGESTLYLDHSYQEITREEALSPIFS